ncbi:integrator complex subunit 3 homolog [Onthophagus taurus]|uniref:integrator complex subunit 3 homolog n=1 Tax=Onthophagus taurus TaxID=166361 RepID=UPI0039BE6166
MEQVKTSQSRLFVTSVVENKDDLEEKFERSYQLVQSLTSGLSDKEAHDALNNALLKDKGYEEVSFGLLVIILTEPQNAAKCYHDLTLITRDGFGLILTHLSQLVLDRYLRFNDVVKNQLLWLLREMIRNSVSNVDNLCWNLMRHAAGGDVSVKNITLIDKLLDVFIEFRAWLDKFPLLLASVVYTYLRLIEDHNSPNLLQLKQKEIHFLIGVLRERFHECLVLGRDLVRLLQNVARIPEFEQLWKDILGSPKSLSPSFNGILQLLQTRTSRRFLQSRLTPEMERKLVFLTSQVRFGNHKRYQDWFQRQYLSTPESQSLRCDMIRFIVGVIHPTNELLCSDIIPRWAVIGWLLTTCTSSVAASNAKLSLFYDWLFFDSEKDNIMNIEPAILVMHHSMRSHPAVSATLLDFLCRIILNFYPPLTEKVRNGIFSSLRQILDKRVLPSLVPLFDNAKLDRELRNMIRETFKEFCQGVVIESNPKSEADYPILKIDDDENQFNNINNHEDPVFSDEEDEPLLIQTEEDTDDDDIPLAKVRLKEKIQDKPEVDGPLKIALNKLQFEKDSIKRYEILEEIMKNIIETDEELFPIISKTLLTTDFFRTDFFPNTLTDDSLLSSIKSPIFALFEPLLNTKSREKIIKFIGELANSQTNLGYLLLYYLKVKKTPLKTSIYKDFCQTIEKKLDNSLYDDLNACHINDINLMMWIVPDLYKDFKQQTLNNAQILRVIISSIDAGQLQDLIGDILRGKLIMFKNDSLQNLLKTSLTWESIEQFFFWQLIQAHDISIDTITPILTHLNYREHPEALTSITLMLKQDKPTSDTIKHLFSRDIRNNCDPFVFTMIKYWCDSDLDKLGELIATLLSTRYPATSPNKRKRAKISAAVPSADQVLGHLDLLRLNCCEKQQHQEGLLGLFALDSMQRALNVAQNNSTDGQKKLFADLFALTEEEEDTTAVVKRGPGRGRKPAAKSAPKRPVKEISESSEESSEEEEIVKPKQAKKRKKVMSDSD